jgi:hypothetical protein
MTRGRLPKKGLDEALPIAQARGRLMQFVDGPPFEYDFLFMSDERICCVWVKRTRHIWCTPKEMESQCAEAIAKYRCLPAPADLTREIWYWSPYGIFRFFRIDKDGLVEINRSGQDLAPLTKNPRPRRRPV